MTIHEQTERLTTRALPRPASVPTAEWTAAPLRPAARWVAVAQDNGRQRLEMTWRVPDPQAAGGL